MLQNTVKIPIIMQTHVENLPFENEIKKLHKTLISNLKSVKSKPKNIIKNMQNRKMSKHHIFRLVYPQVIIEFKPQVK